MLLILLSTNVSRNRFYVIQRPFFFVCVCAFICTHLELCPFRILLLEEHCFAVWAGDGLCLCKGLWCRAEWSPGARPAASENAGSGRTSPRKSVMAHCDVLIKALVSQRLPKQDSQVDAFHIPNGFKYHRHVPLLASSTFTDCICFFTQVSAWARIRKGS